MKRACEVSTADNGSSGSGEGTLWYQCKATRSIVIVDDEDFRFECAHCSIM